MPTKDSTPGLACITTEVDESVICTLERALEVARDEGARGVVVLLDIPGGEGHVNFWGDDLIQLLGLVEFSKSSLCNRLRGEGD